MVLGTRLKPKVIHLIARRAMFPTPFLANDALLVAVASWRNMAMSKSCNEREVVSGLLRERARSGRRAHSPRKHWPVCPSLPARARLVSLPLELRNLGVRFS